jgi:1,4-alpha-glucan branching enzyme
MKPASLLKEPPDAATQSLKDFKTMFTESTPGGAGPRISAKRNLHHANLFCRAPEAQHVSLVGDFNHWNPAAAPMRRMPDGRWMASLELPHGYHQYLFLVDGKPVLDPDASGKARNERNEPVSLLAIS